MSSELSGEVNRQDDVMAEAPVPPDPPAQQPSIPAPSLNQVRRDFDSSVAEKQQRWSEIGLRKHFADRLDRWLWKEVLDTRCKVIRDYISLNTRQDGEDEPLLQKLRLELISDLDEHCKAFMRFQKMTDVHHSYMGISTPEDRRLFRAAVKIMTADEFEKEANTSNDEPKKTFIQQQRSTMLTSLDEELERLHWVDSRRRFYPVNELAQNLSRYTMSFFGGFALLVPMTIMVLHPGRATALVTTIISVFAVALGLSLSLPIYPRVGPSDAFTAVAIYSAVLVVFVGASTESDKGGTDKRDIVIASALLGGVFFVLVFWGVCVMCWRADALRSESIHERTDRQREEV